MEKFRDIYRIPSARAVWWNYDGNGLYFITICTAGRICYFGAVETQHLASLPHHMFGIQSNNLASVIRGFKIGVKKYATMNKIEFEWQSRFYDHIIRNDQEYQRIKFYMENNPANWIQDKLFSGT